MHVPAFAIHAPRAGGAKTGGRVGRVLEFQSTPPVQLAALADREKISVDALVALALNAQAPAWLARESIAARAKRGGVKNSTA